MSFSSPRSHLFLTELILNIFIFIVCASICTALFLHAQHLEQKSRILTDAVYLAETAAEQYRSGQSVSETNTTENGVSYCISTQEIPAKKGISAAEVSILCDGNVVYSLTVKTYDGGGLHG